MKFRSVKRMFKKAAVMGVIAFSLPTLASACSFRFEGMGTEVGAHDFTENVGELIESSSLDDSGAEIFGDALRQIAEDYAYENDAEFIKAKVVRVVDGDTIVVEVDGQETKVRLIGVNTPESVAPEEYLENTGKENTEEGKDASDFTKRLLAEHPYVYLEKDEEETDKYGRSLYYVWIENPTGLSNDIRISDIEDKMLNGILLKEGVAELAIYKPNVKYADEFAAIVSGQTDDYEIDR